MILFYKGERLLHRHRVNDDVDDFAKGVSDAIQGFQRTYADFDLWDEEVSLKVLRTDALAEGDDKDA